MQNELKQQYTAFKAQYGLINSTANKRAFRQDSSYCLLASLEILDEEKNIKRLADIFTKRTIRKPEPVTSVDTPSEALALSIGEKRRKKHGHPSWLPAHKKNDTQKEGARVFFISCLCYCRQRYSIQNYLLLTAFKAFISCVTFFRFVMPLYIKRHTQ